MRIWLIRLLPFVIVYVLAAACLSPTLPVSSGVTLTSDFQTELGCRDDWAPNCSATRLIEQGNGVWRGLYTIPMGNWQYKMTLNDTREISYPSDNKLLNVSANSEVYFYYDSKTNAVIDSAFPILF